ncbi:MAG: hypothetical protein GY716_18100 [bacterium]|nr:hypothetical protein [bacterium]
MSPSRTRRPCPRSARYLALGVGLWLSLMLTPVAPAQTVTEIIDATGDGTNALNLPQELAVDAAGSVYLSGGSGNNAFEILSPTACDTGGPLCTITQIIDSTGDGMGNPVNGGFYIAVDAAGNVYFGATVSDNVFRITPGGVVTERFSIRAATGRATPSTIPRASPSMPRATSTSSESTPTTCSRSTPRAPAAPAAPRAPSPS